MELIQFNTAAGFLEIAQPWMEEREVENNLILGIALLLVKNPDYHRVQPFMAVVTQAGKPILAALMTAPFNLVLAGQPQPAALETLAGGLVEKGIDLPGVTGPRPTSHAFAELWSELTRRKLQTRMQMRVYELTRVIQPSLPTGYLREAGEGDLALVTDWVIAFRQEALHETGDLEKIKLQMERLISEHKIFIWDDGGPVSIAASTRPTLRGVSINQVYTPPPLRRKGYASACVAALSQLQLEAGYKYCCLFTDLTNPTSNQIYMDIGYQPVCDFVVYRFVDGEGDPDPDRQG